MPYCPLCKTEDAYNYGYCRECGVPTVTKDTASAKPSRTTLWGDRIGTFVTQVMVVSLTTGFSAYLGGCLGGAVTMLALTATGSELTAGIALFAGAVLGTLVGCFLLGWSTSPWIGYATAWTGALLPAFALLSLGTAVTYVHGKAQGNTCPFLFLFAGTGAVSVISGTRFRKTRKWYFLVTPVLWAAIVTTILVTSSN